MTDETTGPSKKNVLSLFNAAIETSAAPPTKAEIERARRVASVESALVNLRDVFLENGIADGDGVKSSQVASTLQSLHRKSIAAINTIPDNVLDPEAAPAAPKAPRKPRETKTATLSDADKVAAARRHADQTTEDAIAQAQAYADLEAEETAIKERTDAKNGDVQTEAVIFAAPGAITPEAPTVEEINAAATQSPVVGQRPPLTRPAPIPAEAPNSAADPRGAEDPNLGDGF